MFKILFHLLLVLCSFTRGRGKIALENDICQKKKKKKKKKKNRLADFNKKILSFGLSSCKINLCIQFMMMCLLHCSSNMNLIGATYICASKLSSHAS